MVSTRLSHSIAKGILSFRKKAIFGWLSAAFMGAQAVLMSVAIGLQVPAQANVFYACRGLWAVLLIAWIGNRIRIHESKAEKQLSIAEQLAPAYSYKGLVDQWFLSIGLGNLELSIRSFKISMIAGWFAAIRYDQFQRRFGTNFFQVSPFPACRPGDRNS